MPVTVVNASVETYKPEAETPTLTIPESGLTGQVEITRRIQEWKDIARMDFDATGGTLAGRLTSGDRVEFNARISDTKQTSGSYGTASFGGGSYGGYSRGQPLVAWTGFSHVPGYTSRAGTLVDATVDLSDFVFQVLSDRRVYNSYVGARIDTIARDLLADYAPELDPSGIADIEQTFTRAYDGVDALQAFIELARVSDCVLASDGTQVILRPLSDLPDAFVLRPRDYGVISATGNDANVVTDMRVDGSEDTKIDEAQESVTTYSRVTDTTRLTVDLDPKKSRIDHVEVWTRDTGNPDGIIVRIQESNDAGTAPIDPSDETLDITRRNLSEEFLETEGWTTFLLPREPLPPDPWLIIESDGANGQDIGVNGTGVPAYRTHYPFPIAVRTRDEDAEAEYRWRMGRRKRDDLASFGAARAIADSALAHNSVPDKFISFDADSLRAHTVTPATVLHVDQPEIDAVGEFVVTEVSHTYDADEVVLSTDVTAQRIDTV